MSEVPPVVSREEWDAMTLEQRAAAAAAWIDRSPPTVTDIVRTVQVALRMLRKTPYRTLTDLPTGAGSPLDVIPLGAIVTIESLQMMIDAEEPALAVSVRWCPHLGRARYAHQVRMNDLEAYDEPPPSVYRLTGV